MATEEQAQAVRTAFAAQVGADVAGEVTDGLNLDRFLDANGHVDADKVGAIASRLGGRGDRSRNFGAGRAGADRYPGPRSAGADEAERRFGPPVERKREGKQETSRPNSAGLAEARRRFGQRR